MTKTATRDDRRVSVLAARLRELLTQTDLATAIAHTLIELHADKGDSTALVSAHQAGVSRRTWRALIKSGELPGSLIGREFFVRRVDLDGFIARRAVKPAAAVPAPLARIPRSSPASRDIDALIAAGKVREVANG